MTSPLPPPWAAKVWVEGDLLYVDLPDVSLHPGGVTYVDANMVPLISHRLCFPCDLYGMSRLQALLRNRGTHSKLGTKGDMTQHNVDKDIALLKRKIDPDKLRRGMKVQDKFTSPMRQAARDVMRRLGL